MSNAAEPDAMIEREQLRSGQHLGRYELLRPIGRGGMATVWAARLAGTRGFQKLVAVKAMLPDLRNEPDAEQMFMREAAVASRIRHPNVVEIFDVGDEGGVLYIVMEWVHGEPLSTVVTAAAKQQGMPLGVGVRIGVQMCEGLHAAHELSDEAGKPTGLVHRDVSPHNILVGFNGTVKVTDFGIAKVQAEAGHVTRVGHVKGKLGYMAPEQILFQPVDRRTDVFAAGVVMYVMTTGRHPFRKQEQHETVQALCCEDPRPPSELVPNYSKRLEGVILRALAKDPKDRYATAQDFASDLARTLPPSKGRTNQQEIRDYAQSLLTERMEHHRELLRHALDGTGGIAHPGGAGPPAQSSSTLRAVSVSSEDGSDAGDPVRSSSETDTEPPQRSTRRFRVRTATTAVAVALGAVIGAVGVSRLAPSSPNGEREGLTAAGSGIGDESRTSAASDHASVSNEDTERTPAAVPADAGTSTLPSDETDTPEESASLPPVKRISRATAVPRKTPVRSAASPTELKDPYTE